MNDKRIADQRPSDLALTAGRLLVATDQGVLEVDVSSAACVRGCVLGLLVTASDALNFQAELAVAVLAKQTFVCVHSAALCRDRSPCCARLVLTPLARDNNAMRCTQLHTAIRSGDWE